MAVTLLNKDLMLRSAPSSIFTFGGGTIDPLNPNPEDITIESIAHALANQCRWTGHVKCFYSVAEHSVLVSKIEPTLEALLHDGSEYALSDLARPVKHAPGLGETYLECEARLERAIALRFGLSWPWSRATKKADDAMLCREAEYLVPHLGAIMPPAPPRTPIPRCWTPEEAEKAFLRRFEQLGGRV